LYVTKRIYFTKDHFNFLPAGASSKKKLATGSSKRLVVSRWRQPASARA
jgi:hypothetical protein